MRIALSLLLITLSEATIGVFVKLTDGLIPILQHLPREVGQQTEAGYGQLRHSTRPGGGRLLAPPDGRALGALTHGAGYPCSGRRHP